jgi:hypothetical protein
MRRWRAAVVVLGLGLLTVLAAQGTAADAPGKPRLVVLIVFDQMRGDYLARWNDLFTGDGFRRLEREGTWFTNCHYPYAGTQTGPGHASLATGCSPDRHGIVTNDWFDRAAGQSVYCATTDRYSTVYSFPPEKERSVGKKAGGASPERMLTPTFADALKDATGGKAKVVAVSLKDRSAVLPGGRRPDACYWFDDRSGTFVTSTYYRDAPHTWVTEYNRTKPADRWFTAQWTRLRGDLDYEKYSGPDDIAAEALGVGRKQGRVFPHPMNAGLKKPGREYYDTVTATPFGNDLLLDFALHALEAENLGAHDTPDFLSISFSSNDILGHSYGPDSQEVLDVTLRSDLIIRDLLNALDRKVGKGRYAVALSADHGICTLPELSAAHGKDAKRIAAVPLIAGAVAFLDKTYGSPGQQGVWVEYQAFPWVFLNQRLLAARGLSTADVAETLAGYLRRQTGVQAVYTRAQIENGPADDEILRKLRKSYYADRCGDLAIVSKPYYQITSYPTGTSHGTPHAYDTFVPLVVAGPGVPVGRSDDAVTPQVVVPFLAWAAGVAPPATAEAPLPERLRRK